MTRPSRSTALFLQEADATIAIFDLRGFSKLAARLGPVELGASLSRFYGHAEALVEGNGGRVVKFMGDAVLCAWVATEVDEHQRRACAAIVESHRGREAWIEAGVKQQLPVLDYSLGAATGHVLAGQFGTAKMMGFDVLGEAVNIAHKLTSVATARGLDHLITAEVIASPTGRIPAIEVEGLELGGKQLRLFRLE